MAASSIRRPLIVSAAVAFAVALIGGLLTDIGPWYQDLRQPAWKPPDWLFGPAWTVIFSLTALAAARGWQYAPDWRRRGQITALFFINAALNVAWSALFFFARRPDYALVEVGLLWLSIALLMLLMRKDVPSASLLLLPYLAWVTFAAALNLEVVRLNGPFG